VPGFFVTGTDTGVGKTLVACALARGLRGRGLEVGVMKPVETGVGPDGPQDAQALQAAAGCSDALGEICPLALPLAAAPSVAAEEAGIGIALSWLRDRFKVLAARHTWMIVEGAGGLLVPLSSEATMADLALALGLPLVVVARGRLGTINHTRLTLEAAERCALPLAGVVVSHAEGPLSPADSANLAALRGWLGERLVGELPPIARGSPTPLHTIDLDALMKASSG
jgi:dethiobiotin synthetase